MFDPKVSLADKHRGRERFCSYLWMADPDKYPFAPSEVTPGPRLRWVYHRGYAWTWCKRHVIHIWHVVDKQRTYYWYKHQYNNSLLYYNEPCVASEKEVRRKSLLRAEEQFIKAEKDLEELEPNWKQDNIMSWYHFECQGVEKIEELMHERK